MLLHGTVGQYFFSLSRLLLQPGFKKKTNTQSPLALRLRQQYCYFLMVCEALH